jgi:P pilus assembly chaperone PapD
MKAIVSDDTLNKALRIKSFKRCAGLPHVMPPSSSFEAEYYLSDGTFTAHNLSGFYVTVKMEDGTVIKGERKLVKPSSHTQS